MIRDPRGMMGIIRNAWSSILDHADYSPQPPKTVERAGVQLENAIISHWQFINLERREREFGATVIDMGVRPAIVASVRGQELQYTNIYQEVVTTQLRHLQGFEDFAKVG